jgi:adenylyltransferase/sulfurtransferase
MDSLLLQRYARQIALPGFGAEGQRRLLGGSVLVVGAGGLGCPALQYLAGAGTGRIGIIDGDAVASDNLHRQVLYTEQDIGHPKAVVAADKLRKINSAVRAEPYHFRLDTTNASDLVGRYDIILDCTDDIPSRYLLDDTCRALRKPLVYGAVHRYEGQVAVFHGIDGTSYRDLFPTPSPDAARRNCSTDGVLGMLTGMIGMVQATETLSILMGRVPTLAGRLWTFDLRSMTSEIFSINPLTHMNPVSSPPDTTAAAPSVPLVSLPDDTLLLDVREEYEYGVDDEWIAGKELIRIPLSGLPDSIHLLPRERDIAVFCNSGYRSRIAVRLLSAVPGFNRVSNLEHPSHHEER